MESPIIVSPGEIIPVSLIPSTDKKKNKALTLGPGLRYTPPSTISTVIAGELCVDSKKRALWIENGGGRVRSKPHHTTSPRS